VDDDATGLGSETRNEKRTNIAGSDLGRFPETKEMLARYFLGEVRRFQCSGSQGRTKHRGD